MPSEHPGPQGTAPHPRGWREPFLPPPRERANSSVLTRHVRDVFQAASPGALTAVGCCSQPHQVGKGSGVRAMPGGEAGRLRACGTEAPGARRGRRARQLHGEKPPGYRHGRHFKWFQLCLHPCKQKGNLNEGRAISQAPRRRGALWPQLLFFSLGFTSTEVMSFSCTCL